MKLIFLLAMILLIGCQRERLDDCITSTGPMRVEERAVGDFHAVDLSDRVDVVLTARPAGTVSVEAGRNLLDQVKTEVRDGILYISNGNSCNWVRSFKPRITLSVPLAEVYKLTLRGTGNVSSADTLRAPFLDIEQWGGQGTVDLDVVVEHCRVGFHTGAGDVQLRGRCGRNLELFSGIMAPIDASGLRSPKVGVNNSGVSDIRCWATDTLEVQLNGVGNVYYRGDPPMIARQITGSGSVIRMD